MEFTQYVLLGVVIAGMTEMLKRLRARDYWGAGTIMTAAVIGGIFGYLGLDGLQSVIHGISAGFGVSGAMSVVSAVSVKDPTEPRPFTK